MSHDGDLITLDGRACAALRADLSPRRRAGVAGRHRALGDVRLVPVRRRGSPLGRRRARLRRRVASGRRPTRPANRPATTGPSSPVGWSPSIRPRSSRSPGGASCCASSCTPRARATRLVFTQVLSHRSVAARNGAGWHMCLGQLGRLLDVPPSAEEEAAGFGVYEGYVHRMAEPGVPGAGRIDRLGVRPSRPARSGSGTRSSDPDEVAVWGGSRPGRRPRPLGHPLGRHRLGRPRHRGRASPAIPSGRPVARTPRPARHVPRGGQGRPRHPRRLRGHLPQLLRALVGPVGRRLGVRRRRCRSSSSGSPSTMSKRS